MFEVAEHSGALQELFGNLCVVSLGWSTGCEDETEGSQGQQGWNHPRSILQNPEKLRLHPAGSH